jgi:ferredoxin
MAKLIVHYESGEPDRVIEFDPRKAPFQHDGEPASILDVLLGHGAFLEHACGGVCACTTCHVVVKQGGDKLKPVRGQRGGPARQGGGPDAHVAARLSGGRARSDAVIEITVPRYTVNIESGSHGR